MSARRAVPALLFLFTLTLAACARDGFTRSDAISRLAETGLSDVEATCMADTLVALGRVEAADPNRPRDDASREMLIAASSRCVTTAVLPRSEERSAIELDMDDDDPEGTPMDDQRGVSALTSSDDLAVLRPRAIAHLTLSGRTEDQAACVVDHLIQLDAHWLFVDPAFGMGLEPLEADAFAACL